MMSSLVYRRTTLHSIPQASRRLTSSSSTTVRKSKAETQTFPSVQVDSSAAQTILSPSNSKSDVQDTNFRTTEGASISSAGSTKDTLYSKNTMASDAGSSTQNTLDRPFPAPYQHSPPPLPPRSPITNWILASPRRTTALFQIGDWLGYGSPKQVAARRSKLIYNVCSEVAVGLEQDFWYNTLSLPPSFQSWFTITNLHVWLVTVRLRALPSTHGRHFVQALIDHFFLDVEDRLRAVLGKKAPERLVTRHMKIFREQWAGLGLACDIALMTGDKDMASAMWRNLLGARGARGITYSDNITPSTGHARPAEVPPEHSSQSPQKSNDLSSGGVTDFEGPAIDKYVMYPQLMLVLTSYVRRELVRTEQISNTSILGGEGRGVRESFFGPGPEIDAAEATVDLMEAFKFGSVKDAARKIDAEIQIATGLQLASLSSRRLSTF